MNELVILSPLFDYPKHFTPPFYKKLSEEIGEDNIKVIHFSSKEERAKEIIFKETGRVFEELSYTSKLGFFKIRMLKDYIEDHIKNKFKYLILCDGTDVSYNKNISNFKNVLEYYDTNIVIGSEWFLWPNTDFTHKYKELPDKTQKYLNSGCILAEVDEWLLRANSILKRYPNYLDQGAWHAEYLLNDHVKLDFDNKLVLNTYGVPSYYEIKNNKVIFKNNIDPIFIHDNGGTGDGTIKIVDYFR